MPKLPCNTFASRSEPSGHSYQRRASSGKNLGQQLLTRMLAAFLIIKQSGHLKLHSQSVKRTPGPQLRAH